MTDVTDGMVEAALRQWFNYATWSTTRTQAPWASDEIGRMTKAIEGALAARPRIAGDAVEAARSMIKRQGWDGWICAIKDSELAAIIAAADAVRGQTVVRWRKPEEWTPRPETGWGYIWIWWLAVGTKLGPRLCSHPMSGQLPPGTLAWTEQPAPPSWAETAPPVASTQAEASPGAQATGDAHEAPVAEPAPVFTKEIRELVRHLSSAIIVMTRHNNMPVASAKIARLKMAAFPDPAP